MVYGRINHRQATETEKTMSYINLAYEVFLILILIVLF